MISEFNWWLLLLGLVVGGGLTWLVLAETRRREQDLEEADLADEAVWLEERLAEEGRPLSPDMIERVVQLHREYLAVVPPSDEADEWLPTRPPGRARMPGGPPGGKEPRPGFPRVSRRCPSGRRRHRRRSHQRPSGPARRTGRPERSRGG